ncbi:hypothetical protein SAMN05421833_11340 [Microbispora rosea]|uniref:Major Facilitator Superfamily protein n=1 Tax=Microbispora rosea TaxID=58117 RepID=A0A1N7D036_9ACTN|nr:hypothetical protein [Microbispora rosea]GIH48824.1 hypothetical protein Mro03_40030 [Microbispora rosea subsp. rosea]SIR69278.1 hypothetical protein SAMN05421833_11340 [Microbispora rosea]
MGGEWGGAVLIAAEHAGPKRIFYAAFAQQGSPAGSILATGMLALVNLLPEDAFLSYGWRIPFLASAVLLVIGPVIRLRVEESPDFVRLREQREVAKLPVAEVLRPAWPLVLLGIGASGVGIASAYFTNTFILSWATSDLGIAKGTVLIVMTPVTFLLVGTGSAPLATLGLTLSIVFGGASYAALAGFLAEVLGWTRTWTGSPPMPSSTSAGRRWCRGSTTPTTT